MDYSGQNEEQSSLLSEDIDIEKVKEEARQTFQNNKKLKTQKTKKKARFLAAEELFPLIACFIVFTLVSSLVFYFVNIRLIPGVIKQHQQNQFFNAQQQLGHKITNQNDYIINWGSYVVSQRNSSSICQSSYAESAIQMAEIYFSEYPLSVQQILDCDKSNNGCKGGSGFNAMKYLLDKVIAQEKDYSTIQYKKKKPQQQQCQIDKFMNTKEKNSLQQFLILPNDTQILSLNDIQRNEQQQKCQDLKEMLEEGPVLIEISDINQIKQLQFNDGILSHENSKNIQSKQMHNVVLLGYTSEYWIIQHNDSKVLEKYGGNNNQIVKIKMGEYFNMCQSGLQFYSKHSRISQSKFQSMQRFFKIAQ